jgi:hypothetical protein
MLHVQASTDLSQTPEALWQKIGSFQGVGEWHPMLERVEGTGEQPGAFRRPHTTQGQEQVERLEEIDPQQHFYRYSIVTSPMPVSNYVAESRVRENADGTSRVLWSADFKVTNGDESATAQMVRDFFTTGLEALKKTFTQ